jgi:hypothetical protein
MLNLPAKPPQYDELCIAVVLQPPAEEAAHALCAHSACRVETAEALELQKRAAEGLNNDEIAPRLDSRLSDWAGGFDRWQYHLAMLHQDAIRPWYHRSWIFPRGPDFGEPKRLYTFRRDNAAPAINVAVAQSAQPIDMGAIPNSD